MKENLRILFGLVIIGLMLTACQVPPESQPAANDPERSLEEAPDQENAMFETAYPAEEDAPVQTTPEVDAAYPITEEDLSLLSKAWQLSAYYEDGVVQGLMVKTLKFNPDGSYEMAAESETNTSSGTTTGSWTTRLTAIESTLILNDSSGETLTFEILKLEEALLILQSWRENIQIEEQFEPVN